MKERHGILIWLVVLFAVFPIADGMVRGAVLDGVPTQDHLMGNLVATVTMAMIILGMACVFSNKHA